MDTSSTWLPIAVTAISIGAVLYLFGSKRRRPTQHDLDPTLKKNQIRITTQKKAFRREDLPPEYLASIQRKDVVEIPMGAPRPDPPSTSLAPALASPSDAWLPDHLQTTTKKNKRKN